MANRNQRKQTFQKQKPKVIITRKPILNTKQAVPLFEEVKLTESQLEEQKKKEKNFLILFALLPAFIDLMEDIPFYSIPHQKANEFMEVCRNSDNILLQTSSMLEHEHQVIIQMEFRKWLKENFEF